jgi:hypothetical protein
LTRRAAATLVAAIALACGGGQDGDWDAGAVRAVARQADAGRGELRLLIHRNVGGPGGAEMPFGMRQALTTAGFELADDDALSTPGARVLLFERSARADGGWRVDVAVHDTPDPEMRHGSRIAWRVRCIDGSCEAADSAARPPT